MLHSTPARQRFSQSRAPSSVPSARRNTAPPIEIPELPRYQAPSAPLSIDHQRKLANLVTAGEYNDLKVHLDYAIKTLTNSAGEVNERLTEARVRYEKNKERRRKRNASEDQNDEDEEAGDDTETADQERLGEFERKAEAVTDQLEQRMRSIIDSETRLRGIHDSMLKVSRQEQEPSTATPLPRQTRRQRRRREDDDDDEDGFDEDPDDGDYEEAQERQARERNARNPPSRRFKNALQKEADDWSAMSLTARYSANNNYIGFYRMVHDAKFPNDEAPPLPHSSTWFSHLEDANAGSPGRRATRNHPQLSDDDDIAIAREKVSLKCPITLQTFQDPVTSAKCRHTFERGAIEDMIRQSIITHVPVSGGRRVHAVRCPECSTINTQEDFRPDHVILRRVKRAEEEKARRAEEQLEGESQMDLPNHVTLGSDVGEPDEMDVDVEVEVDMDGTPAPSARVKTEPRQGSSDNEVESESESDGGMDEDNESESESEEDEDSD